MQNQALTAHPGFLSRQGQTLKLPAPHQNKIANPGRAIRWPILCAWLILFIPSLGEATDFEAFPYEPFAQLYNNNAAAQAACEAAQAALPVTGFGNWINGQAIGKTECTFRGSELFIPNNLTGLCPQGLTTWAFRIEYCREEGFCGSLNAFHTTQRFAFCENGTPLCPEGEFWNEQTQQCEVVPPPPPPCKDCGPPPDCGVGNPCDPASGNKYQRETDLSIPDGFTLTRHYNSKQSNISSAAGLFGNNWASSFQKRLTINSPTVGASGRIVVHQVNGREEAIVFPSNNGQPQELRGDPDSNFVLIDNLSHFVIRYFDGTTDTYSGVGHLLEEKHASGTVTTYAYDADLHLNVAARLQAVNFSTGHSITFAYNAQGNVAGLTDPAGRVTGYAYDENENLVQVTYPDGSAKIYHYEDAAFPNHLTGISYREVNGAISRYSTYRYDVEGKAISTEHAVTDNIAPQEKFTLSYDTESQTTVTDPVGVQERMTFATNLGVKNLVAKLNLADGKSLTQTFDAQNNLTCKQDEAGRLTTYTYNTTNQRLSMTEGQSGDCTTPVATATTRTTNFQYLSPTLSLPTVISTPSVAAAQVKTTTMAYADPAHPTLPTQITQGGFTPAGLAVARTVALTYNATGQVISIDGPRTDVSDVTTLVYNVCTTGGGCGQLASVTNALGQTTTYNTYDANGRVTEITDPNGITTGVSYDPRGRVIGVTVAPPAGQGSTRLTQSSYDHIGQLTQTILPNGVTLNYTYDAAQDLRSITDNLGNKIEYGYDLKGNRTTEQTLDPAGTLVRSLETAYDIRNRVAQINAAGSLTQQLRDAVGNLVQETDPNQSAAATPLTTAHDYDALNRLLQTVDNLSGVTAFAYDVNDRLRQVTSPNSATTQFSYDDLSNLLSETSPDRGTLTYTHDTAGNVLTITDARGITSTHTYDALNRVTSIGYPNPAENVSLVYDSGVNCSFGVGRLCQITDESGVTQFAYDAFGNTSEQRKTELGLTYLTRYGYDAGNRIASMTYPDGRLVNYARDALGRISAVTTPVNGAAQDIVTNRSYRADGLVTAMTFGNGLSETRTYDLQGRLIQQSLGSLDVRTYSYDANGNRLTLGTPLGVAQATDYDALDRLTQETQPVGAYALSYDANGNRLGIALGPVSAALSYVPTTNRLVGLSGIDPRTGLPVSASLTYDAAGNPISLDGQVSLAYNGTGRLAQVSAGGLPLAHYTYNSNGQRTRKTTPLGTLVYHYDLRGNLLLETTDTGIPLKAYVWADGQPLAQIAAQSSVVYLHTDHLNTPRLATGAAPLPVWRWDSDAFGALAPSDDPDGDGIKTTINLRFPGQYFDAETGFFYNWNRYYDPRLGRYITSDPIGLDGGLNTYSYVDNNPLRFIDPTGLFLEIPGIDLPAPGGGQNSSICPAAGKDEGVLRKICKAAGKRGVAILFVCRLLLRGGDDDSSGRGPRPPRSPVPGPPRREQPKDPNPVPPPPEK